MGATGVPVVKGPKGISNFCTRCGKPLPTGNESGLCSNHGGPLPPADATIICPFCSEAISATARKCKHCGEILDAELRQTRTPVAAPQRQAWNPGAAAVLSFFIPGLGQMYKGQIGEGIGWLISTLVGYVLLIVPGLIIHIACVYKAYSDIPGQTKQTQK